MIFFFTLSDFFTFVSLSDILPCELRLDELMDLSFFFFLSELEGWKIGESSLDSERNFFFCFS